MPGESLNALLEKVNSEESLLAFIAALVQDRRQAVVAERQNPSSSYGPDAGGWENTSNRGLSRSGSGMGGIH
jgi:hypothetical protein